MTEATGAPLPPPTASPQKTSTWIIALVVIVVVCCGCFGVIGLIVGFWDPIRQELGLSSLLPNLTILM
jgi:hypothetical protein